MYDIYVCQAWIFDIQEEDLNNQTNHSYTLDFLESQSVTMIFLIPELVQGWAGN